MGNILDYHRSKDATIIVISHSMEEMARRADRLVVVNDGRLPLEGTPREVFAHREELEAMGLGVPTMTDLFHRLVLCGKPFFDVSKSSRAHGIYIAGIIEPISSGASCNLQNFRN